MRTGVGLGLIVGLLACGADEGAEARDAGLTDMLVDAALDAADAAPDSAQVLDAAVDGPAPEVACPDDLSWTAGPDLPSPRDHHATFVSDGSLYVAGGFRSGAGVFDDVVRAPIRAGGELGDWVGAGRLPSPRSGMALAEVDGRVYLLGGHDGRGRIASVVSLVADGVVSDARDEAALPAPRFHMAASVHDGVVYATGGLGPDGEATDTVWVSFVMADGTLRPWRGERSLPAPRSHHSSFVHDGSLYLVGGFSGNPVGNRTTPHPDVIQAEIDGDGRLGPWTTLEVVLPAGGLSTHATTVVGDCAVSFAGITDEPQAVSSAVLALDMAGAARVLPTALPVPRSHVHHAPAVDGVFYLVSGKDTFESNTGRC